MKQPFVSSGYGLVAGFDHAVLFTGHMMDAPGRKVERFPARAEAAARVVIEDSVQALLTAQTGRGTIAGIAGGASGGDILFHEVCGEAGVPTLLRLALPIEQYVEASVAPAGEGWVRRFRDLLERLGPAAVKVLDDTVALPESLPAGVKSNIWQKTNLWIVQEALDLAPHRTLLALWDGAAGDGAGGTEDLVRIAPGFGIEVVPVIRTQSPFDPGR